MSLCMQSRGLTQSYSWASRDLLLKQLQELEVTISIFASMADEKDTRFHSESFHLVEKDELDDKALAHGFDVSQVSFMS